MKQNNYLLLFLLTMVILIIIIIYLVYKLKTKEPPKIVTITQEKQVPIIIKSEQQQPKEVPIYPKELPKYNNVEYQQIGILTSNDSEPLILPLFGRKINNRTDRYNYYTASDKNNMIRIHLTYDNKQCEDEIGCKELYNDDKIRIDIYKDKEFTATIYKKDVPRYFASAY